jgi:hypothetical protein
MNNDIQDLPLDVAIQRQPNVDPLIHSHVFSDVKEITENDVLEFTFPETSRQDPLITWTHIKITWPIHKQIKASYSLMVLTPTDLIYLTQYPQYKPVRRSQWLPLEIPIPAYSLEESKIIAVLNIEENDTSQPTYISFKLAGFDHLTPYGQSVPFPCGWTLVDMGLKGRFVPQ